MALFGLLAVAGFGAVVMLLWNALIPSVFGLGVINFWQALGLLALARILFGGIGGGMGDDRMRRMDRGRNPIREKWMEMTPEQRKEFMERKEEDRDFFHGRRPNFGDFRGRDRRSNERPDFNKTNE